MVTVPINLLLCLGFGLALTACARTQLMSGSSPFGRELSLVLSFALLTVAPTTSYFYLTFRDWSWMYLVDPSRLPMGTGMVVVVLAVLLVPAGYLLGWVLLRFFGERGLFAVLGAAVAAAGFLTVVGWQRLTAFGRFEDYSSRSMLRPITQSKLIWAVAATVPLVAIAAVVVGVALWRYGRWLRQQAVTAAQRPPGYLAAAKMSKISAKVTGAMSLSRTPRSP